MAKTQRTLADHRREYTAEAARDRLATTARTSLFRGLPRQQAKPHVHRYSEVNFMCRCGKHGRAW